MNDADFIVIGAGMAGVTSAWHLARYGRVVLLEGEAAAGYHSTGRSVAVFSELYGSPAIRELTRRSRGFLTTPPDDFGTGSLLKARGALYVARTERAGLLDERFREWRDLAAGVAHLDPRQTLEQCPVLAPDHGAVLEPGAADIDVAALHMGFLRGFKNRGGELVLDAAVQALERRTGRWFVRAGGVTYSAPVVVNAAGAWADAVGELAGFDPVGLMPLRRSAFTFQPSMPVDMTGWPIVAAIDESFYFKPEGGDVLASPANEDPSPPCDVQPDEMDIAIGVHRIEEATRFEVRRVKAKWAGLRVFGPDRALVLGPEPGEPSFIWCAGIGGYGIQIAPALGALTAELAAGHALPPTFAGLAVARFRSSKRAFQPAPSG